MKKDFLAFLECRLDSVLWRSGFFISARYLRQLIRHNFFKVNGAFVSYPSFRLKVGDVVTLSPSLILRIFSFFTLTPRSFNFFLFRLMRLVYMLPTSFLSAFLEKGFKLRRYLVTFNKIYRHSSKIKGKRNFLSRSRLLRRALLVSLRWFRYSEFRGDSEVFSKRLSFYAELRHNLKRLKIFRFEFLSSLFKRKFFFLIRSLFFPYRPLLFNTRVLRYTFSSFGVSLIFGSSFFKYPFPMEVRLLFNIYTGFF